MKTTALLTVVSLTLGAGWARGQATNLPPIPSLPAGETCGEPACGPAEACGNAGRFWAEADYLLWWVKGDGLPPLVTTSPTGTSQAQAGVLGQSGIILFGNDTFNDDARSGGRVTLGGWFDHDHTCGLQVGGFLLEGKGEHFAATSSGDPILARPFTNALTGQPVSELIAFPGQQAGSVNVDVGSSVLEGLDILFRENLCSSCGWRIDVLAGYRYLRLADRLGVTENLTATSAMNQLGVAPGTNVIVADRFGTTNSFNGGEGGLVAEYRGPRWSVSAFAKLAVGVNDGEATIAGATRLSQPGQAPVTSTGGLLALSSNIGTFHRNTGTVVPEFGLNLGYQVTDRIGLHLGYGYLHIDRLLRPSGQIDPFINPNLLPPAVVGSSPARPAPLLHQTDLWAQGLNLGVEVRY